MSNPWPLEQATTQSWRPGSSLSFRSAGLVDALSTASSGHVPAGEPGKESKVGCFVEMERFWLVKKMGER